MQLVDFSVVIPLFNKEKSINSTIESVLKQTYPNFELIIVNDGSTDNSLEVAKSYNDTRIKIVTKANGGVSSARNKGIELAQSQYIVLLDADDIWLPYCLEEFNELICEYDEAEVFCTNYNMTGKTLIGSNESYIVNDFYFTSAYFLARWSIPLMVTGCVAIRKDIFDDIGLFNQDITHGEDIDMWSRLPGKVTIAKSEKVTLIYRTEAENRASLVEEGSKVKARGFEIVSRNRASRSQQLFFGVLLVLRCRSISQLFSSLGTIFDLLKYFDWFVRGLVFIIKVRILKISQSPVRR